MKTLKTAETDSLLICMIQRGLTVEQLAADCGVERVTMSNQLSQNFPSRRLRLVVEDVLSLPIWSGQVEYQNRRLFASRCGFNPFVLTAPQIRQRLAGLKIRARSHVRRKAALIELLQNHFTKAQHPNPNPPKT